MLERVESDRVVAGDGAADNGAGSVVVMEAARILGTLGVKPRRTIRFALWAGEEQGLLGSMAYVEKYLATRAPSTQSHETSLERYLRWRYRFPITPRPGYKDLVAYFNIDNGSGRVHGIHAEGNVAAVPLLRDWLQPFASMGAGSVSPRRPAALVMTTTPIARHHAARASAQRLRLDCHRRAAATATCRSA